MAKPVTITAQRAVNSNDFPFLVWNGFFKGNYMKYLGNILKRQALFLSAAAVIAFSFVVMSVSAYAAVGQKSARDLREESERLLMEEKQNEVSDYDLVVIEDNAVPMAPAPELGKKRTAPVIWMTVIGLGLIGIVIYSISYFRFRERMRVIEKDLSREDRRRLARRDVLLCPHKRDELADEMENEVVSRYI